MIVSLRFEFHADRVQNYSLSAFLISCKQTGMAEQKCCHAGLILEPSNPAAQQP